MEKLRKVEFDLQKFDEEGVPETSNKGAWFDYTETIKRRKGLFHEWGKSLFTKKRRHRSRNHSWNCRRRRDKRGPRCYSRKNQIS